MIERILSPDHPVMVISNSKYWMGPDIIAAKGLKSRVRDLWPGLGFRWQIRRDLPD